MSDETLADGIQRKPANHGDFTATLYELGIDPARKPATIPQLAAFRDCPSKETHLAAARLLKKCGDMVLDGTLYKLGGMGRILMVKPENPTKPKKANPKDDEAANLRFDEAD